MVVHFRNRQGLQLPLDDSAPIASARSLAAFSYSDWKGTAWYHVPMDANARKLELTEADLLGHEVEEISCNQCGGAFCGLRAGRVLDGKPLIMCGRKDEVKEILAALKRR